MEKFEPILRFAVMSDLHYSDRHTKVRGRFRSAMDTVYRYCEGESYPKLDALYIVGDFTDLGATEDVEHLAEDCKTCLKAETEPVVMLAGHDLHFVEDYQQATEDFCRIFQTTPDRHEVFGGYHFISLSSTFAPQMSPWHDSFDAPKQAFLRNALEEARKDGGNKPIFVFHHAGIPGTIPGGMYGYSELYPVLSDYPQVIDFSGHSHIPINHPKEIWQGDFTAVSTGSIYYLTTAANLINPHVTAKETEESRLDYDTAHALVVEVDQNQCVRIRRLDVTAGDFFENDSYISNPADKSSHIYTQQRAKHAPTPYFENGAELSAQRKDGKILLNFPAAQCEGERVAEYNIVLRDKNGVVLYQRNITSGYHHLAQPTHYTTETKNHPDAASVLVYANGFWDNRSEPLVASIV